MEGTLRASVVVALRAASPADIEALLDGLQAQTLSPESFEVILVLAPGDLTPPREPGEGFTVRVLSNPDVTAAAGLNRAVAAARAPFIIRLDARTRPAPDYLEACLDARRATRADCVGGAMVPRGEGLVGRAFAALSQGYLGTGGAVFRHPPLAPREVDTVYLGAWPRDVLVTARGFDESLARNQDDELARRLRKRGGRIVLDPTIRSTYLVRERVAGLLLQYFRYGLDKPAALRGFWSDLALRQLGPPAFTLALGLLAGLAAAGIAPLVSGTALSALVLLHLVFGALSPPGATIAERLVAAPLTTGLHLAYGAGFLCGLPRLLLIPAPRPGLSPREEAC